MASSIIWNQLSRQIQQVQQDLTRLESDDTLPGLQGQISVSLNGIRKSSDELEELAKREISMEKREKGRVQKARSEYFALKGSFDRCKQRISAKIVAKERDDLLDRRTASTVSRSNATDDANTALPSHLQQHAAMVRETKVLDASSSQLDDFINIGRTALNELHEQRGVLKSSKRRMLDIANSLGMSSTLIKYIEKRSVQDQWFLLFGILISLILMWAIVHYLT